MGKVLGIDLGTTNSVVAVVEAGEPTVIPTEQGARTMPSMVAFTSEGELLVGHIAKRQALTNPTRTIYSVKRLVGRKAKSDEVRLLQDTLPYELTAAPNGDARVKIDQRELSPAEISAYILQKLKKNAEEYLGEEVTDAVITCPAYFDDSQRQATKDAGRIAGLNVLRIVNEPTAASLAYGLDRDVGDQVVAVYDLGGGTFDISILRISGGVTEVLATNGNTHLGGDDFDQRILDWLVEGFLDEHDIDLREDKMALQRLREAAERAKWELSVAESTEINLPFIAADRSGPKHLNTVLTRAQFEELCAQLLQMTIDPCRQAMEDCGLDPKDIDEVILVGGQTRMPKVIQVVTEFFGKDPCREVNPDEVVAVGAAIQGGVLSGEVKDLLLLDVTPLSLGVETLGGIFTRLIERNTTIPTKRSQVFSTAVDNQSTVAVHVLQGEREMASQNRTLARFELTGIPPAPRGVPQIEVTFSIDANGIVHVSAKDLATGRQQAIRVTAGSGLSESEIRKIVSEAARHAEEDQVRRDKAALRNQIDGLAYTIERSLTGYREQLGESVADEVSQALQRARQGDRADASIEELKDVLESMQLVSNRLTSLIFGDMSKA